MNSRPSRRTALLQLAALAGTAGLHAGCAAVPPPPLLDMHLVDRETGSVLVRYPHRGRQFSPGTPGSRYAIRLVNRSGERVLAVLSVDGVNAITGDTAAWGQTGYVLDPGERCDITGWRKGDDRVAAFEFTSLGEAYAARTGRPAHVGIIGAAVFREVPPPVAAEPPRVAIPASPSLAARLNGVAADAAQPAPEGAAAAMAESRARTRLGTGHGASEWSRIQHTAFQRRTAQPEQLLEIHYDSEANLVAAGIMPRPLAALPRAFPGNGGGYVPDPPARR